MKVYRQVSEDAEYREYYDSYRITVDNLNDTDFLYKTSLSNGQVFFENDEIYGFVNNQPAVRNRNIVITKEYIDNFVIRDFVVYSRALNDLITLNINCNLYHYRDGKPHYLYVVLSHNGKYEVHDDMFQSDSTKILFARFIIDTNGDARQFYMMLPFAGSADYLKGNQFYQVTDGLRVEVFDKNLKQLTLTDAKIRYSAINFEDKSSPDCIYINHHDNYVPIRYVKWDDTDKIPRVNWMNNTVTTLQLDSIMNYSTGKITKINENEWSIQKLYYDVYEHCIVALYGDRAYKSREEAIYGIDTIMSYPLPDGIEYLIPIAALLIPNSKDPWTDDIPRIVNLDYNEKEVLDSDTFTRQQSAEAMQKSRAALDKANEVEGLLEDHVGDRTNPHQVRLDQLLKSDGTQGPIDDSLAGISLSAILSKAAASAEELYYRKTGGQISGNVSISKNLTVEGSTVLKGLSATSISVSGNITPVNSGAFDVGSSANRFNGYFNTLNVASLATFNSKMTTANVAPSSSLSYDLGTSSNRYNYLYAGHADISNSLSTGSASISSTLSVAGASTFDGIITANNRINVNNGYIVIGGYSLRLGTTGSIPTATGYALI